MLIYLLYGVISLLIAFAVHEIGHYLMARYLGYPASFVITKVGPGVWWGSDDVTSSYRDRLLVVSAGPAANVILAIFAYSAGLPLLGACSVLVLLPQLVPLGPTDGKFALRAIRRIP